MPSTVSLSTWDAFLLLDMSSGLELLIILGAVGIVYVIIAGIVIWINKKKSKGRFRKLWFNKFFYFEGTV